MILLAALLGCVNRGQQAPGGGGPDGGGAGGHEGPVDASKDMSATGGGGDGGGTDVDGGGGINSCDVDGGAVVDAAVCNTLWNFESPAGCNLYGASLGRTPENLANTDGFTRLYHTPVAACGMGGLAVDVDLNQTTRLGGEVLIPVTGLGTLQTPKSLTISFKGSMAGGINTKVYVYLITNGYVLLLGPAPITSTWTTLSVTTASAPDAGVDLITGFSLQVHNMSTDSYAGTLFIDEIDIRNASPSTDGGSADGLGGDSRTDGGPTDGPVGDVRDAPPG